MEQYMTSLEISAVWGVEPKSVQYLCRNGKIDGAIKRAGSWFIPNDTPNPFNTDGDDNPFSGTKLKIFDKAIEAFAKKGFESVSLRDLGDIVGITQSTIYNHFSSKQEILDTIYDYFSANFNNNRVPAEKMKQLLVKGTKDEFCSALMFTFEAREKELWARMTLSIKIIYTRIFQDEKAQKIFLGLMNADTEEYIKDILEYGVSAGVLEEFDIPTYAKFLVGQRHIMGIKAFADPNYELRQLEEEKHIMKMSADMLPFKAKK